MNTAERVAKALDGSKLSNRTSLMEKAILMFRDELADINICTHTLDFKDGSIARFLSGSGLSLCILTQDKRV